MTSQRVSSATAAGRFDARGLILKALGIALVAGAAGSNASASENVAFEELGGDQCFMFSLLVPTRQAANSSVALPLELVINNEGDYKKLFDPRILRQSCANVDLSKVIANVDFSKKRCLACGAPDRVLLPVLKKESCETTG
jgi:hypothetical protein